MNQRGEVSLVCTLLIITLMSVVLLCGMELKKSVHQLEKRTHLFLCVKETKGEIHKYMKFMGRTNWAIKNINRASLVMIFIPGLQGAALDADKLKRYLQYVQNLQLASYLKTLKSLSTKGCPVDPRVYITPFEMSAALYTRDVEGAAKLRKTKWNYHFFSKPYFIDLEIDGSSYQGTVPRMIYKTSEKGARLSSLLSSAY